MVYKFKYKLTFDNNTETAIIIKADSELSADILIKEIVRRNDKIVNYERVEI